jgi:DNA-directed RNA polymerase specialized sigma24 family protein
MPIGTVRTHLHRGRNKMRQSLLLRKGAAHAR